MYIGSYQPIERRVWGLALSGVVLFSVLAPVSVSAVGQDPLAGLKKVAKGSGLNKVQDIPTGIGNIIGAIASLIGVLFFMLAIYGGVLWMTAHGNDTQVTKAFSILTSAAIGMVIVVGSAVLVNFIFGLSREGEPLAEESSSSGREIILCCEYRSNEDASKKAIVADEAVCNSICSNPGGYGGCTVVPSYRAACL